MMERIETHYPGLLNKEKKKELNKTTREKENNDGEKEMRGAGLLISKCGKQRMNQNKSYFFKINPFAFCSSYQGIKRSVAKLRLRGHRLESNPVYFG